VRPFVVSAILRGITFTPEVYESFIGLQEKLHENACRRRALVAIGTHDLDVTRPPFFYRARPPTTIEFEPLHVGGESLGVMRADRMLEHFAVCSLTVYPAHPFPHARETARITISWITLMHDVLWEWSC